MDLKADEPKVNGASISETTEVRPLQYPNAYSPIEVTLLGMVKEVRPLQPANAERPIEVTLLGMVKEVRPLQPANAELPIEVTLLGMVKEVRPLQPSNAELPIDVTLLPNITVSNEEPVKGDTKLLLALGMLQLTVRVPEHL